MSESRGSPPDAPCDPPGSLGSIDLDATQAQKVAWFTRCFRPHFESWVFKPIDRLIRSEDALVAFILMSCAIDYLAGFWWGGSTKGRAGPAYKRFVRRYFPEGRYDADGLWESLRNGLLHLFTIKGRRYALTHGNPRVHLQVTSSGQEMLNAQDFLNDLKAAAAAYFADVEADPLLLQKLVERYSREGFLAEVQMEVSVPQEEP
jgi:hypothetical protein